MESKHSFLRGLNRDVSKDKFPSDAYYYLLNGRILTDDDATMSDIINLKSNTAANINDNGHVRTSYSIIGYTTVQNDIILFYATNATTSDNYSTSCTIDVLEYQGSNAYERRVVWEGTGMNFRTDKKIRAIARYEASDIKKVYWTDNNENLRHVNIAEDVSTQDVSEFDFIGDFFDTPQIHHESYTSGSLKQGMIHYAYRYVKLNGYKTVFSQVSLPIPLSRTVGYGESIGNVQGDPVYDEDNSFNTGKGVRLRVTINNTDYLDYYDYIEVVSLWHSAKGSVPDITITNRINLSTGTTTYHFIDEGTDNYGIIEYSSFLAQQSDFTAKDIEAKDNRLFAANITEDFFDLDDAIGSYWDARAYRFDFQQSADLLDSNYALEYTIDGTSPDYSAVGQTADAINQYNKITLLSSDAIGASGYPQIFQSDGVTLGGSGLNVEYEFYIGDYYTASVNPNQPGVAGTIENKVQLGIERGFQRDEVYRIGITFFDSKGRQSFVKWMGDVRMPSIEQLGAVSSYSGVDNRIETKILFLQVSLLNVPVIAGETLDWQVVYVKREEADKSVVFSGMLSAGMNDSGDTRASMDMADINDYTLNTGTPVSYNRNNVLVMSPDIVFRKTEYLNIDFIETVGDLTSELPLHRERGNGDPYTWISGGPVYDAAATRINIRRFPTLSPIALTGRHDVSGEVKAPPPSAKEFTVPVGIDAYKHFTALTGGDRGAAHGTAMVYRIDSILPAGTSTGFYYGYGRKIVYDSQYGGQSYENRSGNTYIPASRRDEANLDPIISTRGDTFINFFEYLRLIQIPEVFGKAQSEWMYFICESTINTQLRHDDLYSSNFYLDDTIPTYINENVYVDADTGLSFQALYQYNFVYSHIDDDRKFFPTPLNFVNREEHITRVAYSDVKIDTEEHDSWLSFRPNNHNDASQNYGPINRLEEFYDKIFSFQDNALSLISINPKVTQVSEDGVSISLGTGSVVDDFNYLTTNIGCQDNSDVIKSFSSMYWLDKNKKKIYSYNGKIQSVTDLKGMHSYLKNNVLEDSYFIGTYDIHNSEVVMSIYDDNPNSMFYMLHGTGNTRYLYGDVTLLDYTFRVNNLYQLTDGWYRCTVIADFRIDFEYSHGTDVTPGADVDMHIYMSERDNFTLAYNEKIQAFTSFYSFIPDLYISHNRDFFTSQNSRDLWQHNIGGLFNEFYGEAYPLQLKIISNYGTEAQGEYTNFKYFMTVKDTDNEYLRNETLTNIRSKNEYQDSSDIILYPMHLPNDVDRTRYILDTSSTRIGLDWYTGVSLPDTGLAVYLNELYRNTSGGPSTTTPGDAGWSIADLANIRKTIEHWLGQMPRYDHRDDVFDSTYLTSDRLRSNWLETTFEYRSVGPTINIEEREIKLSDIILSSNPLPF